MDPPSPSFPLSPLRPARQPELLLLLYTTTAADERPIGPILGACGTSAGRRNSPTQSYGSGRRRNPNKQLSYPGDLGEQSAVSSAKPARPVALIVSINLPELPGTDLNCVLLCYINKPEARGPRQGGPRHAALVPWCPGTPRGPQTGSTLPRRRLRARRRTADCDVESRFTKYYTAGQTGQRKPCTYVRVCAC